MFSAAKLIKMSYFREKDWNMTRKIAFFLDNDFLLESEAARALYHEHAEKQPIIDYHCHLDPRLIAENHQFADLTEIWLGGDHYKWRAMRANGVNEAFITGKMPPYEKFLKWAETLPYTMRNPLYHWSHLELNRVFGVEKLLTIETAREIYDHCGALLHQEDFRVQALLRKMNVETVCTTDDPADDLRFHIQIANEGLPFRVLPSWRPDKALAIDQPEAFNAYMTRLEAASNVAILNYERLLEALVKRHAFFEAHGCVLSDHGLDTFYAEPYTAKEIDRIFLDARMGKALTALDARKFKSALLYDLAVMDADSGWAQQYHVGPNRNNNERMFAALGPDTGFDAIADEPIAASMNRFFSRLDREGHLTRTIVYNLNPRDNALMVANAYNFNDGTTPGKMQYGAAWWFNDHIRGMRAQIDALSDLGLLSRFVGMLTDSRSFLSYPRHEYFRRVLCDALGEDVERGLLPVSEMPFIGRMVETICHGNAKAYFRL